MNEFLQDILCPISREKIDYPVIAADGFTYEESFFRSWVASSSISPMIGTSLPSTTTTDNKTLAYLIARHNYYTDSIAHLKLRTASPKSYVINPLPTSLKHKLAKLMLDYFHLSQPLSVLYTHLDALLKEYPGVQQILLEYANMKRFGCDLEEALKLIEKAQKESLVCTIPKYMKARLVSIQGDPFAGKELVDGVQKENPVIDHTLLEVRYLSSAMVNVKSKSAAFKLITAYIAVCPDDMRASLNQIYALYIMKDSDRVLEYSKIFLDKYKYDACVAYYRAKAYALKKERDEAFKYFDLILNQSKEPMFLAQCYYDKALLRQSATEFDEMKTELEAAFSLYPKINADIVLADLYRNRKQYSEAARWLDSYASRVDKATDIYYNRMCATLSVETGNKEEAIRCYTVLIEKDGANAAYYSMKIESLL